MLKDITIRCSTGFILGIMLLMIALPVRAEQKGQTIKILTTTQDSYIGQLLYASDSVLVVWQGDETFDLNMLYTFARSFQPAEIGTIILVKKNHFWKGVGFGTLIGGGIGAVSGLVSGDDTDGGLLQFSAGEKALMGGILLGLAGGVTGGVIGALSDIDDEIVTGGDHSLFMDCLPKLKSGSAFPYFPPKEMKKYLTDKTELLPAEPDEPAIKPVFTKSSVDSGTVAVTDPETLTASGKKWHLGFGGALVMSSADNDMIEAYEESGLGPTVTGFLGTIDYPVNKTNPFSTNIELLYSVHDKIRTGISISQLNRRKVEGPEDEFEEVWGYAYALAVDFVPRPASELFHSRWELAVGCGVSYNALHAKGSVMQYYFEPFEEDKANYSVEKNGIGAFVHCSLDYYISGNISCQLNIGGQWSPSLNIPEKSCTFDYGDDSETVTLKEHSVNMSGVNIGLGLRLHI